LSEDELKNVENIAPKLDRRKAVVVAGVMRDGRVSDVEFMKPMGLKSANAASYYRKDLEKKGIIEGYVAVIDWKKLGYPTEFMVLLEGGDTQTSFDVEKEFIAALEEYAKKKGSIFILPSGNGRVIIKDIFTCFGERPMTLIMGHATSDHDAIIYSRYYVAEKFVNAKTTFLLIKGKGIENFFINRAYIDFMKGSFREEKTLELPSEFKKRFPSLVKREEK
ncbi:MAG: hypothetical protein ACE5NL_02280, partial [Candidatus Hydrothermarchaeaceae archaeon]